MRKLGFVLCVLGLLVAGAVPALAKIATNGESLNGENLNGVRLNGAAPAETGVSLSGARALRGRLVH